MTFETEHQPHDENHRKGSFKTPSPIQRERVQCVENFTTVVVSSSTESGGQYRVLLVSNETAGGGAPPCTEAVSSTEG